MANLSGGRCGAPYAYEYGMNGFVYRHKDTHNSNLGKVRRLIAESSTMLRRAGDYKCRVNWQICVVRLDLFTGVREQIPLKVRA